MRLVALTSWYDEPVDQLERAVRHAIAAGVTHYVAIDGRYKHFQGPDTSPPDQAAIICRTCDEHGIPCHVDVCTDVTEPEKRTRLFQLAREFTTSREDWLFVHDADHKLHRIRDLKPQLRNLRRDDAALMMVIERDQGPFAPTHQRRFMRSMFRNLPGLHVHPSSHWTYLDGDNRTLWGFNSIPAQTILPVYIENHSTRRTDERNTARNAYYNDRHHLQLETDYAPTRCYYCNLPPTRQINADLSLERCPDGEWDLIHRRTLFVCDKHHAHQQTINGRRLRASITLVLHAHPHLEPRVIELLRQRGALKRQRMTLPTRSLGSSKRSRTQAGRSN